MVFTEEKMALSKIKVVPFIMADLNEQVYPDKVSNQTILRTIRFNVEEWREGARKAIGTVSDEGDLYWAGRVGAYQKVLDLIDSIQGGLK